MTFNLYYVQDNSLRNLDKFETLESDKVYLIVDKSNNSPKIWIWVGDNASVNSRYHAGMLATRVKSQMHYFSAAVEIVDENSIPSYFPNLSNMKLEITDITEISRKKIKKLQLKAIPIGEVSDWFEEEELHEEIEEPAVDASEEIVDEFTEERIEEVEIAPPEELEAVETITEIEPTLYKPKIPTRIELENIPKEESVVKKMGIGTKELMKNLWDKRMNPKHEREQKRVKESVLDKLEEGTEELMEHLLEKSVSPEPEEDKESARIAHLEKMRREREELFGISEDNYLEDIGLPNESVDEPQIDEQQVDEPGLKMITIEPVVDEPEEELDDGSIVDDSVLIVEEYLEQIEKQKKSKQFSSSKEKFKDFLIRVSYLVGELQDTINEFIEDLED